MAILRLHFAHQPGEIGKGLVVEIHADALTFLFHRAGEFQGALAQAFLAGDRFGTPDRRLASPFGHLQRMEIRGEDVRHMGDRGDIGAVVTGLAAGGAGENPNRATHHLHRHIDAAAQGEFEDRPAIGARKDVAFVAQGVVRQHPGCLAGQDRAHR